MASRSKAVRQLGKNGPLVPALGFGVMSMSGAYGTQPEDEERFKLLDRAVELGEVFWDTADHYGDNEEFLGKWFKRTGKRNEIFLASKGGLVLDNGKFTGAVDSSAAYLKRACEASLKRLGVEHIDLYYVSRVNSETPIEQSMRAMAELKAEGKIRHIGLSEVSSSTVIRASKIAPVAAVQMEYSPFELLIETPKGTNILKTCRSLGITTVCYSPLGRGLLTAALLEASSKQGTDDDFRGQRYPRFNATNLAGNVKLVKQFQAFADKKACTVSQLALAWLIKQGDDIIPIPSTKRVKYLEENWAALDVELTNEDESEIRQFLKNADIGGARAMPGVETMAFVETKEE